MLFQNVVDTWRISRNPGSNWRAVHAGNALVVSCCLLIASVLTLAVDWPSFFRAILFLVFALLFFIYWRYLLPEAKRIHENKIVFPEKRGIQKGER